MNQLCIIWGYQEKLSSRQPVVTPSVLTSRCHDLIPLRGRLPTTLQLPSSTPIPPILRHIIMTYGPRGGADRAAITRICIFAWGRGGRARRRARGCRAAAVRVSRPDSARNLSVGAQPAARD